MCFSDGGMLIVCSCEHIWGGDIWVIIAPVSSCVQGTDGHAWKTLVCSSPIPSKVLTINPLTKNTKHKGSRQMTRIFPRFSGGNKRRAEEKVCEGRLRTRARGMAGHTSWQACWEVDGLVTKEGASLGSMLVELRRHGMDNMMLSVGVTT